jgi:two-component system heavy metal sensor histidine kinase CusS
MFSKRTEPRSIASQLVLLFTPAAALLLFCALGVLYVIVVRHAFEEDNVFLADKISALRSDLNKPTWPETLNEQLVRSDARSVYWIRVIDSSGHNVVATSGMETLLPASIFPSPQKSAVRPQKDYRTDGKLFSLAATMARTGVQPYTIQVAQDRSADEEFTKQFGALLVVVLAFGILASALIAITVTRRGLRPLVEMTGSLKRVGPDHFHERVPRSQWPRELQPVAIAFDEMLDRLEHSFTRLSQFSADLAHELRTPIANLMGEAQVSLTRVREPSEYREVIESSVAECERLSGLIDNLLFLARVEAPGKHIQPTLFDARAAVEKIAVFHQTIADEQNVAITCAGEGTVYADSMLFGRAVSNLVENALRFTPAGGTVVIDIAVRTAQSEISVADTGCGIAPEHLLRVFDRFYRVDPSRSSHGTGLGLALVKSITDLHGGSVKLDSKVGRGTTVTLTFPNKA